MYLINHFLDTLVLGQPTPDVSQANVTNGVSGTGSLGAQVATCAAANGRNPNYMLVDASVMFLSVYILLIDLHVVLRVRWRIRFPSCSHSKRRNLHPDQSHCHPHYRHFNSYGWIL
jgi:hypothetical protein